MIEVQVWCNLPNQLTASAIKVGPGVSNGSLEVLLGIPETEADHDNIFLNVKVCIYQHVA